MMQEKGTEKVFLWWQRCSKATLPKQDRILTLILSLNDAFMSDQKHPYLTVSMSKCL